MIDRKKYQLSKKIEQVINNKDLLNVEFIEDNRTYTYLSYSILNGYIEEVAMLLRNGANPNTAYQGESLLNLSLNQQHQEKYNLIVNLLLEHGAQANFSGRHNRSPIMTAIEKENIFAIKLLIDYGADINYGHNEPLKIATRKNNFKIIELLLKSGVTIPNNHILLSNASENKELMKIFIQYFFSYYEAIKYIFSHTYYINNDHKKKLETLKYLLGYARNIDEEELIFKTDDPDYINQLLSAGANIDIRDLYYNTPLIRAAKRDYLELCDYYISAGANLYLQDKEGNTVLHILLKSIKDKYKNEPRRKTIIKLISIWNDFTVLNSNNESIERLCQKIKDPNIVKILVERGICFPSFIKLAWTLMDQSLLKVLLTNGFITTKNKKTVHKVLELNNLELINILFQKKFAFNKEEKITAFLIAMKKREFSFAERLLRTNKDELILFQELIISTILDSKDSKFIKFLIISQYPLKEYQMKEVLEIATITSDINLLNLVLDNNIKIKKELIIDFKDCQDNTLGHLACSYPNFDILLIFLANGLDTTKRNKKGESLIEKIISQNCFSLSQVSNILPYININKCDIKGYSPIAQAYLQDNFKLVELFLINGGDPNCYYNSYDKTTLLMKAIDEVKRKYSLLLINEGANLNIQNLEGNTALHYAYRINDNEMINLLITMGADPNIENNDGKLPITINKKYR